jgi:2-desacetyl-2-hydroxyethyl bacteriochlorophyllide A dehydrogenase
VRLRGGSWAPLVVTPAHLVYQLPAAISDRLAAVMEPLACAVRAVDRAALTPGDRVCIIGGGPIGLLVLAVVRAAGAGQVIVSEPHAYRRQLAHQLGADVVIDPTTTDLAQAIAELTDGVGAELIFEAVGVPATIEQAIASAAPGGTVVIVGVTDRDEAASFRPQTLFFKELTIKASREATFMAERALRWLTRLDLTPLLTHTLPLADVQTAIDIALAGQAGKVLLRPLRQ